MKTSRVAFLWYVPSKEGLVPHAPGLRNRGKKLIFIEHLLCARLYAKSLANIISLQPGEVESGPPYFKDEGPAAQKVHGFAQGHLHGQGWTGTQILCQGYFMLDLLAFFCARNTFGRVMKPRDPFSESQS